MQTKIKNAPKRKIRRRSRPASRTVFLVHAKRPVLRHFRLVDHKHTGKLIHFRHTSHLALTGILIITGFFLLVAVPLVSSETQSGPVVIGVIVPANPPKVGAVITHPLDGASFTDQSVIEVSGTCLATTFVVVKDNGLVAGSTNCTVAAIFVMNIQLQVGKNVINALNYDNLNQAGPVTASVSVSLVKPNQVAEVFVPIIPANPSIIPGLQATHSDCNEYNAGNLPTGGEPQVAVVCVPRFFTPKIEQVLGILVWGGAPPYALAIDFSDGLGATLVSISKPGYITHSFNYQFPGTYKIDFKLSDLQGKTALVETVAQANGVPVTGSGASPSATDDTTTSSNPAVRIINEIMQSSWFQSPVPFYMVAVAITLGFWGGDIFDHKWGAGKINPRKRQAT